MSEKAIKIGLIPAAGKGSRLGFLSNLLPKALFPLYDRPILHYVINQMEDMGIEDIYIIVHTYKEKIMQYIDLIKMDLKARVHFIVQESLNGTASAILLAEKEIKDRPFLVMYGDDCTITESLLPMAELFFKKDAVVVEGVVKEENKKILQQTCSVNIGPDSKMIEVIEKPEKPPYLVRGCGVYIFSSKIFEYIKNTPVHPIRQEKEITYTINSIAHDGRAFVYTIQGENININDYDELLKASVLVKNQNRP